MRLKEQYRNELIIKINNKKMNFENKEVNKDIVINNEIKEEDENNDNQLNQNSIQDMIENNKIENVNDTTPQ